MDPNGSIFRVFQQVPVPNSTPTPHHMSTCWMSISIMIPMYIYISFVEPAKTRILYRNSRIEKQGNQVFLP